MAEVLVAFDTPVADESGAYRTRAIGRQAEDGMWEGWLEFEPIDPLGSRAAGSGATPIVGPVESRQPERDHLVYWATGLTPIYLEGALNRARRPLIVRTRVVEEPFSDEPAPRAVTVAMPPRVLRREAVLDPFEVAGQSGLEVLDQELRALNRPRLLNIIAEFDLNPGDEDINWMSDTQLVRFIVVAVETQLLNRVR
jgi:hypothetical protein